MTQALEALVGSSLDDLRFAEDEGLGWVAVRQELGQLRNAFGRSIEFRLAVNAEALPTLLQNPGESSDAAPIVVQLSTAGGAAARVQLGEVRRQIEACNLAGFDCPILDVRFPDETAWGDITGALAWFERSAGSDGPALFLETSPADAWADRIQDIVQKDLRLGAKLVWDESDPPTAEALADWIVTCIELDVPMRFGAGSQIGFTLDRPTGPHFGFVNLLAAVALAECHELARREVVQVLLEPSGSRWDMSQDTLRCGDFTMRASEIELQTCHGLGLLDPAVALEPILGAGGRP